MNKSKQLSATKLPLAQRLESVTFFVDRSLGEREVPETLRQAGLNVVAHDEVFAKDAPDIVWLEHCGQHEWVVLSKDKWIKRNPLERQALFAAGVAAFFLSRGDLSGAANAQAILKGLKRIANLLASERRPFIARITPDGKVELWLNHKGKERLR